APRPPREPTKPTAIRANAEASRAPRSGGGPTRLSSKVVERVERTFSANVDPSQCSQTLRPPDVSVARSNPIELRPLVRLRIVPCAQLEPPTSIAAPACSIVRRKPSRSDTSGDQP